MNDDRCNWTSAELGEGIQAPAVIPTVSATVRTSPRPHSSDIGASEIALTDGELIARARAFDRDACDCLVRRHYRAVYAVAMAVLQHQEDAEDCCHDALVRALAHLEDCREPDKFANWVAAIARNHARNYLASSTVRRAQPLDSCALATQPAAPALLDTADLRARLESALSHLSYEQREVVLLHDLNDWSHFRIAEWIGTSAGMCRQHLFKARRKLRDLLGPTVLQEHRHE